MARAAVIPGVSASTDAPQHRATRGRGRTPTATTDVPEVKKSEPAKRGRKPGKTTTTTTTTTTTAAAAKNKKSAGEDGEDDEDDDLDFDVTTKRNTKSTASKSTRSTRQVAVKSVAEVEDNASSEEEEDDDELADFEVTKKKAGRPTKAKVAPSTTTTTKPARGRPKTVKANEQQDAATDKKTRGRRPAAKTTDNNRTKTIYVATASTTSSLAKTRTLGDAARIKKTVTFADLTDSDNEVSDAEVKKPAKNAAKKATAATKSSGLKAKPVRKAGTATRGRPPKSQTAAVKPLSPKKATQLAKGSSSSASSGDEDELAREKTVYSLVVQKSPVKTQEPQHTGLSSPVKRIMLPSQTSTPARPPTRPTMHQDENSVPSLQNSQPSSALRDSAFMGSPARRPPPSTSKETIRDTPRRGPLFISHASASKLSSNTESNSFMQKLSPLKVSPKKGANLGTSFLSASPEKGPSTPFNAKLSLLKSPAKRIQSPFIFQKVHESKPLQTESNTTDRDADTEMRDGDDDVFVDDGKAEPSHSVVDELSDDELSTDKQTIRTADNDDSDVFVEQQPEQEQVDDYGDASDVEQEAEEVEEDSAELVPEIESAVESANEERDQPENIVQEDVEMSQDEPSDVDDENQNPPEVQNAGLSEANDNAESDAEMEEDIPHQDEEHEKREKTPEGDNVQFVTDEDVQQTTVNEQQSTADEHVEEAAEAEAADCNEHDDTLTEIHTPRSNATLHSARSSIASREVVNADEVDELASVSAQGTPRFAPPAAPSPPVVFRTSHFGTSYRDQSDDMISEYGASPASRRQSIFSSRDSILPSSNSAEDTFTSLAAQLDSWKASSPAKQRGNPPQQSIFSPVVPKNLATPRRSMQGNKYSQVQSMRRSLAARHSLANSVVMDGDESDTIARQSPKDVSNQAVGGNDQPQVPQTATTTKPQDKPQPRLSMSITPVRVNRDAIRTVHTVSKVPLKPEAEESPIKYPRKRARSMSIDIQLPIRASPGRFKLVPKSRKATPDCDSPTKKRSPLSEIEDTQESGDHAAPSSTTVSPAKTPRRDLKADQQCLRGAVVFVDVHTTEGEDASGIFVELLTQMGAKCVKSWAWNPRSSHSPGVDGSEPVNNSKVGITHVVYKDGGVRTMEKVRQAGGLVKCVGVGWVLDCERASKWIDEAHYYVDSTIIPRGGAKRRKSMQPRALANVNGSLMSSTSSSSSSSSLSSSIGHSSSTSNRRSRLPNDLEDTMEDFRRMSPSNSVNENNNSNGPKTPTSTKSQSHRDNNNNNDDDDSEYNFNFNFDFSTMSPATPGFLTQNARLVQQTCPPKQTNQGLFSSMLSSHRHGGGVDDDVSPVGANLRAKLEAARRKSLAFKPRFGSPLSRS